MWCSIGIAKREVVSDNMPPQRYNRRRVAGSTSMELVFKIVLTLGAAAANDGPIAEADGPVASRRRTGTQHSMVTVPGFCGPTPESSDCWLGVKLYVKTKVCMAGQRGPSGWWPGGP